MDRKRGVSRMPKCGFRGIGLSSCYVLTLKLTLKFLDPPRLPLSLFSHSWVAVQEPRPCVWRSRSWVFDVAGQIFAPARHLWTYLYDALPQYADGTFVCLTWFRRPSHARTQSEGWVRTNRDCRCDHTSESGLFVLYLGGTETIVVGGTVC